MVLISDSWIFDLLVLSVCIFWLIYLFVKHKHTYWERKGFKSYPDPHLLFGHLKPTFTQKANIGELIARVYENSNEPFVGIYVFVWPTIVVCDPEAVQNVLIRDFEYFTDHGLYYDEDRDPISGNLLQLPGHKWRNLRGKLSPTFSPGKLKAMFSTMVDCGSSLQSRLENIYDSGESLDIREIAACYATNVIASVAFGIDVDAIKDPNNEFRECGRKIFASNFWNAVRFSLNFLAPKLMSFLHLTSFDPCAEKFLIPLVKQNMEYREKNNVTRKDFFQLLIQLRNTGKVQADDEWETVINDDESQKTFSLNEMAAQSFALFVGGFETSSLTETYCMYELAKNPEIQTQVHEEIDRVLQKHNGKITYESISEMKYLEACIHEALRKYPLSPILNRLCVKDYKIPGTNKVIEKGTQVFIPALGLHMDEQYYDDPEKFKPERFLDENSAGKIYLAFGDGPRNCIGYKMGKMQVKVGLVLMLQNFRYELESQRDIKFDPRAFFLVPKDSVKLRIIKR